MEIVSPESRIRDEQEKLQEYQRGEVQEYWLIDPARQTATFYQLSAAGEHQPAPASPDGVYRSNVLPGLWIKLDWLWQDPLPSLAFVLQEWQLLP